MNEEIKQCPYCGEGIRVEAQKCRHCGEWLGESTVQRNYNAPTSRTKEFPPELNKFNWGVLIWSWLWGLTYGKPITLIVLPIAFIPVVGAFINLGLVIWFGIKGNQWAWQNKYWDSVEQFNTIQKRWVIWGCVLIGIIAILSTIYVVGMINGFSGD